MTTPPPNPRIYHITSVDNVRSILKSGCINSDALIIQAGVKTTSIAISAIKKRRLYEIEVKCHPGTKVGEYVPFYFCPRSIMLYLISAGNHPDLPYTGGQRRIVHLEANLQAVLDWASTRQHPWAFSNGNAGAYYSRFFNSSEDLNQIDWDAVMAEDFRNVKTKEAKQSEFLFYNSFPWALVSQIGVFDEQARNEVEADIVGIEHRPDVVVQRKWYY